MSTLTTNLLRRLLSLSCQDASFLCIRWILALVFLYSGVIKLIDPPRFAQIIAGFGLVPPLLLMPTALLLPAVEMIAGIGLLFNKRGSLATITMMLVLFMAVLTYGIYLGLDIDCGCFGPEDPEQAYKGLKKALLRDTVLMAAVMSLYWHTHNKGRAGHASEARKLDTRTL